MIKRIDGWWVPSNRRFEDKSHAARSQEPYAGAQIDRALAHVRVPAPFVVQAGARVGLWPRLLQERGCTVLAFEPDRDNFACCERNLEGYGGIELRRSALGDHCGAATLKYSPYSSGEAHVDPTGEQSVLMETLDRSALSRCDLVMLDVEGGEFGALLGAIDTLKRCHPTVVVEENGLGERYGHPPGAVAGFLLALGYRQVEEFSTLPPEVQNDGAFHGSDLIFA